MEDSRHQRPLADRDVRLLARLLDRSLVLLAVLPMVVAFVVAPLEEGATPLYGDSLYAGPPLLGLAIVATQWVLLGTRGQSLAKIALGIRIERTDGSPAGFLRAVVLRDWVFAVFALTGILAIIDGLLILGESRQTLHDLLADTRVVQIGGGQP